MAKKKNPGGRPTLYKPEYNDQAYKLTLLGATDKEMADFFEVNQDTIYEWQKKYPKFSESIRDGKIKADSQVAQKLYERAIGAEWIEQQAFKVKRQKAPGVFDEEIEVVDVKRAAPPDTLAITRWLTNRQSTKWADKQDINNTHTFTVMGTVKKDGAEISFNVGEDA